MKKLMLLSFVATGFTCAIQAENASDRPAFPRVPPPIYVKTETTVRVQAPPGETYVYDQKPLQAPPALITREQADAVVDKFRDAYAKLGNPRFLIYVNRELVDTASGIKLTARNEKVDTTQTRVESTVDAVPHPANGNVTINANGSATVNSGRDLDINGKGTITRSTDNIHTENRYTTTDRKLTMADKQTVRDVERLFGRPLRAAGATLADQGVATQLIADRPLRDIVANTEGEQAKKDREALKNISDVVVEILISSRSVVVQEVSGNKSYSAPDIQATATRLSDAKIIGQASARDVLGKDRYSSRILRNFDVEEISEATALALMEDITNTAK